MKSPETQKKKPRCRHISKIGSRCHADPQTGKDYCFFHDPEQKKKQADARKQGGEARSRQTEPEVKLPPDLPVVSLENAGNVFDLLAETVHHLQCGKMDIRVAKALAYLSSLLLRALKADPPTVAGLLATTINQLRRGETDLSVAKTIGNLAAIMLTAFKQQAQEAQPAAPMEMENIRPAEAMHPANMPVNSLGEAPRSDNLEALISSLVAAKPMNDHAPHPRAVGMTNGTNNTEATHASQPRG